MIDSLNLADALRPCIEDVGDSEMRSDMEDAVNWMKDFVIEIAPTCPVNTSVPEMRKADQKKFVGGEALVISREVLNVMGTDQSVVFMLRLRHKDGRSRTNRRPADAVLAELRPTHFDPADTHISLHKHEETVGGQARLF